MSDIDDRTAHAAGLTRTPAGTAPGRFGCCLGIVLGGLLGLVLGGAYGVREYNAAVDEAVREHGSADYLPVGVLVWSIAGALFGSVGASALLALSRLFAFGPTQPR